MTGRADGETKDALSSARERLSQAANMRDTYRHVRDQFDDRSDEYAMAREMYDRVDVTLYRILGEAHAAGVGVDEIARVLDVDRRCVRRLLEDQATRT